MPQEPSIIYIGTTLEWTRLSVDTTYTDASGVSIACLASEWTLIYNFAGTAGAFEITAAADGDDFLVSVSASVTDAYVAGEYSWIACVEKGAGATLDRRIVDRGTCKVVAGVDEYVFGLDNRSHVKKVLDAIEAVILGRATSDQQAYTIAGRSLQRTPLPDLIQLRQLYKAEYDAELAEEKANNGETTGRRYLVRFGSIS